MPQRREKWRAVKGRINLRMARPFFPRSMASRRCHRVLGAISTVSEPRMAPSASPLNFALGVSAARKMYGPVGWYTYCQVRQPLLVSRFPPRRTTSLAPAFSLSLLPSSLSFLSALFASTLAVLLPCTLWPPSPSGARCTRGELPGKFVASSTNQQPCLTSLWGDPGCLAVSRDARNLFRNRKVAETDRQVTHMIWHRYTSWGLFGDR